MFEKRDFFKQAFTVDELRALLKSLKLTAHDVISTKSPAYKKMELDVEKLSEEELLVLMVHEPRLLRRPLIVITDLGTERSRLLASSLSELKKSFYTL